MHVRLQRNIFCQGDGLTSRLVYKDYEWAVTPVVGATVEDTAWHRNDTTVVENIFIPEEGQMYCVELNPKEVDSPERVGKVVEIVMAHGWKTFS